MSAAFLPMNPAALGRPSGFSHGLMALAGGRVLFVAGQTAPDAQGSTPVDTFLAQFDAALARVLTVVAEAGGTASQIARLTVYVRDMDAYRASRPRLGAVWTARMGSHYPTMSVVAVTALVEPAAVVELEATAVLS